MMSLSKRERNLAIGAGATVGSLLLYFVILSPLLDSWDALKKGQQDVDQQRNDAQLVFDKQARLQKVWKAMLGAGLQSDASLAESQAENAAYKMAGQAGVTNISLKTERPTTEGSFQVTGFSVDGNGSMRQISQLVYLMESGSIPLHVTEVQILPLREGTDDLKIHLSFSTICLLAPDKTAGKAARS